MASPEREMRKSLKKFDKQVKLAAKRWPSGSINSLVKNAVGELYDQTLRRSPVDTGHYRKNWQLSSGDVDVDEIEGGLSITHGAPMIASERLYLMNFQQKIMAGSVNTINMDNPTPYSETIEYGGYGPGPLVSDGYSAQAVGGVATVAYSGTASLLRANEIKPDFDEELNKQLDGDMEP